MPADLQSVIVREHGLAARAIGLRDALDVAHRKIDEPVTRAQVVPYAPPSTSIAVAGTAAVDATRGTRRWSVR